MRRLNACGLSLLLAFAPALPARRAASQPAQSGAETKLIREAFVDGDRLSYNGYEVLRLEKKVRHEDAAGVNAPPGPVNVSYAVLKRKGRVLAKFDGVFFGAGNATDFGLFNLLGGRDKQLVVSQTIPRGGRHWVVSLSPRFKVIYDSGAYGLGREELSALDLDGDGVHEISQELTTFVFFEDLTTGASHIIDIVFKYDARAGAYLPASHLFPDYTLAGARAAGLNRSDARAFASDVLRRMLPGIYAGRRDEAWDFFEREYTLPNKAELKARINAALRRDPVYRYIYRPARAGK